MLLTSTSLEGRRVIRPLRGGDGNARSESPPSLGITFFSLHYWLACVCVGCRDNLVDHGF